jgi:hypothetical protein
LRGELLRSLYAFGFVLVEQFMPDCAVIAPGIGILLGLGGLEVDEADALGFQPIPSVCR